MTKENYILKKLDSNFNDRPRYRGQQFILCYPLLKVKIDIKPSDIFISICFKKYIDIIF
jgi:hypothetical protein